MPLTDRIDYLCPMTNNLAYCLAVEKLLGLEIPPRAQWIRVLLNELTRINSHLVWLGTHAMDIGAMTVFLYCFREREEILQHVRDGLRPAHDDLVLPRRRPGHGPPLGSSTREELHESFSRSHRRVRDLLTNNPIWLGRTKGVAYISPEDAIALVLPADAARQRRRLGPAPRHAICGIRKLRVQGSDRDRRGRIRPVHGPRG